MEQTKTFKILSQEEAQTFVALDDSKKWNIVSITDKPGEYAFFPTAKTILRLQFADISKEESGWIAPNVEHIKEALRFYKDKENILCHCFAGISRSVAMTYIILLDYYKNHDNPVDTALQHIMIIRPICYPNKLIVDLGINLVARNQDEEIQWFRDFYNNPIKKRIYGS